jgi:hypothetical protein
MDDPKQTRGGHAPMRERIDRLRTSIDLLQRAIREEIEWRQKLLPAPDEDDEEEDDFL